LKTLAIKYPESVLATLNLRPETFEQEARIALAVKLYEMGRLTSGQAADLAGIPRVAFLLNCQRYGTATIAWDREELEAEFSNKMQ
jgi:predicted HTH domain antitoxin